MHYHVAGYKKVSFSINAHLLLVEKTFEKYQEVRSNLRPKTQYNDWHAA